jgi:hypothetical protein
LNISTTLAIGRLHMGQSFICRPHSAGVLKIEAGIWVNARYHHQPTQITCWEQQGPSKWENRTDARAQMATLAAAAKDAAGSVSLTKKNNTRKCMSGEQ